MRDRRACDVDVSAEDVLAAVQEVPLPALGVEADDVVRKQAFVHLAPQMLRQHVPVVGLRPRDVDEVHDQRIGSSRAHELRREVEVVVVEEHRRRRLALELGDRRVGEGLVDGEIAVEPRVVQPEVEIRRVRQPPHVVLEEPQRRVRDDVVVPVVGRRVVRRRGGCDTRAVARSLVDRIATVLAGDDAILVAHRARDPRHLVSRDEAAQRGDEPAAAATRDPLAVCDRVVRHGPAVCDDDQLAAPLRLVVHHVGTYPADAVGNSRAIPGASRSGGASRASRASSRSRTRRRSSG